MSEERVEVVGELLGSTDKAVKVKVTLADGSESEEWLPRSQLADQWKKEETVGMTIPRWLAEDRGFV
jgi:hypothetical protein